MRALSFLIVTAVLMVSRVAIAEPCAGSIEQLDSQIAEDISGADSLKAFRSLFDTSGKIGIINESKGTFVLIEVRSGEFFATLYSSAFFGLYGLKKEGKLQVCMDDSRLMVDVFGHKEELKIKKTHIVIGAGGPKYTFDAGPITPELSKLHKLAD